ncbi:tRNA/rRNA methyltransferase [Scardovia inopinata]|uniref:tRNA/rRNA methyltransferase SpoU type domain-containing protein n=1 Tax=Scardovia inopinata F0304 TaxID=641146 RepID=W5IIX0_SCAIO|nr:TrmH family RNA methyltransferase [Scardovia inopinata]EFG26805.1 hypothetical protein HMPREF9020_00433 [Scardovia inopinata F0304]BAR06408.1 conserved hypothetical protein [Scardovia inopinata JCM 12537]SUV51924.1 tRNA/rRNA methyltransferase [Scardovia inopinata]
MYEPSDYTKRVMAAGDPGLRKIGVGPWEEEHPGQPRPDQYPLEQPHPDQPHSDQPHPEQLRPDQSHPDKSLPNQPSADNADSSSPSPSVFDPDLLDNGDSRNIMDRYRYWTVDAIKADLDRRGRHSFEVAIENWTHDFNIGSIVRTANAFTARGVHIIGPHKWNRKGSLMTELYQSVDYYASIDEFVHAVRTRDQESGQHTRLIALDIVPGAVPIESYQFPEQCILLFGAEGPGLTSRALEIADDVVYITQYGSVRSLNAGAAAAVAMHAWMMQHG